MQERIQKLLVQAGYGSRRGCEEFITAERDDEIKEEVKKISQESDQANEEILH